MKLGIKFSGGAELAETLNGFPAQVRKRNLYPILRKAAIPMRDRMAQRAPTGSVEETKPDRPGGHLADNIVISATSRIGSVAGGRWRLADEWTAAVAVGPQFEYFWGIFLEYGTVHMAAQPFARPAFDGEVMGALDTIGEGLWDLIVKFAKTKWSTTPSAGGTGTL